MKEKKDGRHSRKQIRQRKRRRMTILALAALLLVASLALIIALPGTKAAGGRDGAAAPETAGTDKTDTAAAESGTGDKSVPSQTESPFPAGASAAPGAGEASSETDETNETNEEPEADENGEENDDKNAEENDEENSEENGDKINEANAAKTLDFTVNGLLSGAEFFRDTEYLIFAWQCGTQADGYTLTVTDSEGKEAVNLSLAPEETSARVALSSLGQDCYTARISALLTGGETLKSELEFSVFKQHETVYKKVDTSLNLAVCVNAYGGVEVLRATPDKDSALKTLSDERYKSWTDVAQVSVGADFLAALTEEGRVLFAGDRAYGVSACEGLVNVRSVCAGSNNLVCVTDDGRLRLFGAFGGMQTELAHLRGVVDVSLVGVDHAAVLFRNGTVRLIGLSEHAQRFAREVSAWTDVVKVSSSLSYTLGLKKDGSVVYAGETTFDLGACASWTDIKDISAGIGYAMGLKQDGSVVNVKKNTLKFVDTEAWRDVEQISAGYYACAGVGADGVLTLSVQQGGKQP
ncbi:MAG: hypothetical protein II875_01540 [Clostridia bacterium]|nr:hypothetical protein [Clostridia bacterium]